MAVNLSLFERQVLAAAVQIPWGQVTTYRLLAAKIGRPRAVRAVGNALNKNPQLGIIPCHRVVQANGLVGHYRLGRKIKRVLLVQEGLEFTGQDKIVNFSQKLFV